VCYGSQTDSTDFLSDLNFGKQKDFFKEEHCQLVEGGDPSPLPRPGEATSAGLSPVWAPQYKRDKDILNRVLQRTRKMMNGLEHLV